MSSSILYLTHRVPYPPDKGDRIRNYHLLRQLAQTQPVSLGCLADEPVTAETNQVLNELCEQVAIVPVGKWGRRLGALTSAITGNSLSEGIFWNAALAKQIDDWHRANPFKAVVISATSLVPYIRRPLWKDVPAFVDVVDVDSQKWVDFSAASRFPMCCMFKFEASRIRKLEQDLPRWARGVSLVSCAEARLYDSIAGKGAATIATNGVDLDYFKPVPTEEKMACAFVGALDYLPNIDASIWFAREIWPEVRKQMPDAEFWLIGRKPTAAVQKLVEIPGVKLIGQVPDVRPHVLASAVAVVPMRLSRGLQNKVLEAMAMGKATIAAAPALAALSAVPGRDLLRADSNEEWVTMIVSLLRDPERRRELGQNARLFVEQNHNWEKCLKPLTVPISHLTCTDEPGIRDNMQENGRQKEIVSR